jgi:hypothetical protein
MSSQKTSIARKRTKPRPSPSPSPAPPDMDLINPPHSALKTPRTPRTPRTARTNGRRTPEAGDEEVSMSLLGESEQRVAAAGLDSDYAHDEDKRFRAPMSAKDKTAMALLIVLCE